MSMSRSQLAWRVAAVVAVVGLVIYFSWVMQYRFHNAWGPYALQGDQQQSIGHFWRYKVEGAVPAGHVISDYATAYHSSPLWWPIMAAMSSVFGPLTSARVLGVVAYALFALGVLFVVGRRTTWALGALSAIVAMRNPADAVAQITGGMARSMSPALLLLFVFALSQRKHRLALVTLVLQAGIYPSIVIPCGLVYGAYCVLAGPTMHDRLRRCAGMFVAGVIVIFLGLSQNRQAPEWWGAPVTYKEAEQMPAWRSGGRFPEVPHRSLENAVRYNLTRSYKKTDGTFAPESLVKLAAKHQEAVFFTGPVAFAFLCGAVGGVRVLWRRRRRRRLAETSDVLLPPLVPSPPNPFPWEALVMLASSVAAFILVREVAFKLFLPSRQVGFVVPFMMLVFMPQLVWWGVRCVLPGARLIPFVVAVLVTVVPSFAFRGHGGSNSQGGYGAKAAEGPLFEEIRKLPFDEEIACDVQLCNYMMPLGQHVPYSAETLTHPLRKGYYAETERRLVENMRLLHATTLEEVEAFVEKERVRYFAYRTTEVDRVSARLYKPASTIVARIFRQGQNRERLFAKPPEEAIMFERGPYRLVNLDKMIIALKARPAVVEPLPPTE